MTLARALAATHARDLRAQMRQQQVAKIQSHKQLALERHRAEALEFRTQRRQNLALHRQQVGRR